MSSSSNLSQLRICVEKMPAFDLNDIHVDHINTFRAAFLKESIWSIDQEITVEFIGDDKNINWTPIDTLINTKDLNGNLIPIDPLEYKVRKLSIKNGFIETIKNRIIPLIGLKIKFVETNGIIKITFDPSKGCYSMIGKQALSVIAGSETMNFAWADVGTFVHEFMHSLGAVHEHQNPKGNSIDWNKAEVYKWALETQGWNEKITNKNIIDKYKIDQLNGSDFDSDSIMLYFYPSKLTLNNKGTHQNMKMSLIDMQWLCNIYPGGKYNAIKFYDNIYNKHSHFYLIIICTCIIILFLILAIWIYIKKHTI